MSDQEWLDDMAEKYEYGDDCYKDDGWDSLADGLRDDPKFMEYMQLRNGIDIK